MKALKWITMTSVLTMPVAAVADECPATGTQTKRWLELQRSGAQASIHPEGIDADVNENIYQRYVNSFTYEIPETFDREQGTEFVSGSSSN
jgi:hypothetical protein